MLLSSSNAHILILFILNRYSTSLHERGESIWRSHFPFLILFFGGSIAGFGMNILLHMVFQRSITRQVSKVCLLLLRTHAYLRICMFVCMYVCVCMYVQYVCMYVIFFH